MSLFGIVGSVAGGLIGRGGAKKAAKAQANAAIVQAAFEEQARDQTRADLKPFYDPGVIAQNALNYELGIGERPTFGGTPLDIVEFTEEVQGIPRPRLTRDDIQSGRGGFGNLLARKDGTRTVRRYRVGDQVFSDRAAAEEYAQANATDTTPYRGFQATPGYQFALDQGMDAIENSAASRGNLFSGATLKDLNEFGTGLANQEYNTFLNRLSGVSATGQNAAAGLGNANANFTAGVGQALANLGNAGAAGAIGRANAATGAIENVLSIGNYMNQQQSGGGGFWNSLFGGP